MCLDTLDFKPPKRWDGVTVYRVAKVRSRVPREWTSLFHGTQPIRLGQPQCRAGTHQIGSPIAPHLQYPAGVHCCLTRDGARTFWAAQGSRCALGATTILKGRITGEIVAKGTQDGVPVVVATSVIWERVVR